MQFTEIKRQLTFPSPWLLKVKKYGQTGSMVLSPVSAAHSCVAYATAIAKVP